ncbi:hypothetical protein J2Y03_000304 [Neobacillus niacini]|uniref:YpoC family protein n=1 Tax=Neobacillus niacini TaxID=86668 RepID=UPI002859C66C|nr:hypothetical protein [Neobacillus niacini]MDR7075316.1 hypothetical protein [Neobacillus niacini]
MDKQIFVPFLEEMELATQIENPDEAISHLLAEWGQVKGELEILYRNREQKTTLQGMKKGIGLFILFLYLSNDSQANLKELEPIDFIEMKPVNLEERLGFIISRPTLFHSYRQLTELMVEQEKLYAKKNIVKKRLSQNG